MWIRTRDRLFTTSDFRIIKTNKGYGIVTKDEYEPLVLYKTRANARKMLDEIEDSIIHFPDGVIYLRGDNEL